MRVPDSAHTSRPWRIHHLAPDFELEDVWRLATPGGPDDFPRLVELIASGDPGRSPSQAARALWAFRWKLGQLLGLDDADTGLGTRVASLRERLPDDLLDRAPGPEFPRLPFQSLYLLEDEWAAEIANRTVHGILHLGWVQDPDGSYRAQMAVLVKTNGLLGRAYLAAIRRFRHRLIYPAMIGELQRRWSSKAATSCYGIDAGCPPGLNPWAAQPPR